MNWEDAYSLYIQQIIKKVRVGEQQGLEDAIAEFTGWLSGAQLSMQQYRVVLMDLLDVYKRQVRRSRQKRRYRNF